MRPDALPLTYDECRARFRRAADSAGAVRHARPIDARGPHGQRLTVDVAVVGTTTPRRALVVMSGVHGVEGFVSSMLQCDLLDGLDGTRFADDAAIVLVHGVNPWGMAWWRRQNESNVDLNRNWGRDDTSPPHNEAYAVVHPLLCPDDPTLPDAESFLEPVGRLIAEHGIDWVRAAVSTGQYTHPDGLYFGGERTEASTRILADVVTEHLGGCERSLIVDLHTGHGAAGTYTLLTQAATGSPSDVWLRRHFDRERIEATVDNPRATTPPKSGQLMLGMSAMLAGGGHPADHHAVTFELGTVANTRMILAERAEHWVHRHGDRHDPVHAAAVWEHRVCSTPDDREWEGVALAHGRTVLRAAVAATVLG